MSCLDAALEYREAGLTPIPVGRDKRPLVGWKKYQTEMPTENEIRLWFAQWPEANVGLVMGRGMFAVDIDGPDGEMALATAGLRDALTLAPQVKTARGRHVYLAGQEIPDRIGLLPHVDIRGQGYVVAPPSVHESGAVYEWTRAIEGVLRPGPAQLYDMIRSNQKSVSAGTLLGGTDWFSQSMVGVAEGGRDATCTRMAGYLLGKGIPQDAAELILQAWAERCQPPFPPDQVSKCVASIAKREGVPDGPPQPLAEALTYVLKNIATPQAGRAAATEFKLLDLLLDGGLDGGTLTYVGAWTSVGKSSFIAQMSRTLGRKRGVLLVSLEMTVESLVRRMLVQESGVPLSVLKQAALAPLSEIQKRMLQVGAERLLPVQLWLTTAPRTPGQLEEVLETYSHGTLGAVFVDYLQKMRTDSYTGDLRMRVSEVSGEMKRLAVKYNIPFVVVSALARTKEAREPQLSDLRESGDLEYDADNVIFLHRPDLNKGETDLILAKQRDGAVGRLKLFFDGPRVTFEEGK